MDPPADSGHLPAQDQTSGSFSKQTTDAFADQTNGSFADQTSPEFSDRTSGNFTDHTSVTPPRNPRAKIVLWGDSLTQISFEGWGSQLANRYQRRADIVNRGMSGYNTAWYLLLPEETHDNVSLCTIWFGANDASLPDLNPHHYVSVEDYQSNLRILVEKARKVLKPSPTTTSGSSKPELKILLITPPPVCHEQRFVYQKQRYGDKATGELERTLENSGIYASACQKVATEMGVPCLNLWETFQKEEKWDNFLSDGLHFSPQGHDFVFKCLEQAIQEHFPALVVTPCPNTGQSCNSGSKCEALTTFGPYHDQIDSKDPDKAMKEAFGGGGGGSDSGSPENKKAKMDAPGKNKKGA